MLNKVYTRLTHSRLVRSQRGQALKAASRHPIAVPLITFSVLVTLTGLGYGVTKFVQGPEPQTDARIVIVSHDRTKQTVPSREKTVGGLLTKLNIQLGPGDVVEPARSANIDQDNFRVNIYRAVPTQVVDGDKISYTFSAAKTARSIASQNKVDVFAEDYIELAPVDNFARTGAIGQRVVIERSVPIMMNLYGSPVSLRTHADTVGDLIKQKKITLAKDDQVIPAKETILTANTQVFITRNGTKIETVEQIIPTPIESIDDPTLTRGTSAVRQKGAAGKKSVTFQVNLQNGKEVSRTPIQEVIILEPVKEVIVRGSAPAAANLEEWLLKLRKCETGGNYQTNTGNGFYGGYQFLLSTWNRIAPKANRPDLVGVRPDLASPADQDYMIIANTKLSSGGLATQNPGCYAKTGISQFPPSN